MTKRPRLLVLDDHEGRVAAALATARLRELAEVSVLDRPLARGDLAGLADVSGRVRDFSHFSLYQRSPRCSRAFAHIDGPVRYERGCWKSRQRPSAGDVAGYYSVSQLGGGGEWGAVPGSRQFAGRLARSASRSECFHPAGTSRFQCSCSALRNLARGGSRTISQ
jgi:hypothetical protein